MEMGAQTNERTLPGSALRVFINQDAEGLLFLKTLPEIVSLTCIRDPFVGNCNRFITPCSIYGVPEPYRLLSVCY